jgi:predicted DNA-binding protein (MmcQ/YjbR family)
VPGCSLSLTGAEETFLRRQDLGFKVAGKSFALSQLDADSLRVSVKCEPELAEALREAYPAVIPGYHLDKRPLAPPKQTASKAPLTLRLIS